MILILILLQLQAILALVPTAQAGSQGSILHARGATSSDEYTSLAAGPHASNKKRHLDFAGSDTGEPTCSAEYTPACPKYTDTDIGIVSKCNTPKTPCAANNNCCLPRGIYSSASSNSRKQYYELKVNADLTLRYYIYGEIEAGDVSSICEEKLNGDHVGEIFQWGEVGYDKLTAKGWTAAVLSNEEEIRGAMLLMREASADNLGNKAGT